MAYSGSSVEMNMPEVDMFDGIGPSDSWGLVFHGASRDLRKRNRVLAIIPLCQTPGEYRCGIIVFGPKFRS